MNRLMKSDLFLPLQKKSLLLEWGVLSIEAEEEAEGEEESIPDHLLQFVASIVSEASFTMKLPKEFVTPIIEKLLRAGTAPCMELALKILGSLKDVSLSALQLRCILLVEFHRIPSNLGAPAANRADNRASAARPFHPVEFEEHGGRAGFRRDVAASSGQGNALGLAEIGAFFARSAGCSASESARAAAHRGFPAGDGAAGGESRVWGAARCAG